MHSSHAFKNRSRIFATSLAPSSSNFSSLIKPLNANSSTPAFPRKSYHDIVIGANAASAAIQSGIGGAVVDGIPNDDDAPPADDVAEYPGRADAGTGPAGGGGAHCADVVNLPAAAFGGWDGCVGGPGFIGVIGAKAVGVLIATDAIRSCVASTGLVGDFGTCVDVHCLLIDTFETIDDRFFAVTQVYDYRW